MKIKIIYPTQLNAENIPVKTRAKTGKLSVLTTSYLAGLTPPEHDIDIIDDLFEDIDYDDPVDLVALTAMTAQAPRAYQIAREYHKRGVLVVMGGFHASFLPDEAAKEVDAVAIGEAEPIWPEILRDAEKKNLKKFYKSFPLQSLAGLPPPRLDLLENKYYKYYQHPVWIGRGCPNNCDYCTVNKFYGPVPKIRPIPDILRDLSLLPGKRAVFIDDNLMAYKKFLFEFLPQLENLKLRWNAVVDSRLSDDDGLLDLSQAAGLERVYIGLENLDQRALNKLNRGWAKPAEYKMLIEKLHRRGISVYASMIFGLGKESFDTVRGTLEKLVEWEIDDLALYFLIPIPGSKLRARLMEEGVKFSNDWSLYDGNNAIIVPDGMTKEEYENLYWSLYQGFYSPGSIFKRLLRLPQKPGNLVMNLCINLLVSRVNVNARRPVLNNFVSYLELIPGWTSIKK